MANRGFLYFLPSARSFTPEKLQEWGLEYLLDDGEGVRIFARGCTGPTGEAGQIIGSSLSFAEPELVKMSADLKWDKFPKSFASQQALIGYRPSEMPGPADLARSSQLSGEFLTLVDGSKWLIPNARKFSDGGVTCPLPVTFGLDEDTGDWIANQVTPKYRRIWDHANSYVEAMVAALREASQSEHPKASFEIPNAREMIVDAFQANYRVSARELATMGVLSDSLVQPIAKILADFTGFDRIKKKAGRVIGAG